MQKPSIPRGTRDFGPLQMAKRNYIFNTIRGVYERYGFAQLETPTMENLSVLTGKYGDEGDQLLFKVLNSGDFLSKSKAEDFESGSKTILPKIAEKGLRYDLTVPFARYVVMHRNDITFPFKRYQIQPVWRADRPQKGRYREFYQCDADVVGTDSLICESEIIAMINEVFTALRLPDFTIKLNNRKILVGITEVIGAEGKEGDFCMAIDKLDKIGLDKVNEELIQKGFSAKSIELLKPIFEFDGTISEKLTFLKDYFSESETGLKGVAETEEILNYLSAYKLENDHLELDLTLARGLSYYTGTIFEVKANGVQIGSITGGGRYDNLTGVFGLKDVSGVGISFGVDRIYDVLEELELYPESTATQVQVMIVNFGQTMTTQGIQLMQSLRNEGIRTEIYPDEAKMKKQMSYANNLNIPFVVMIGEDEIAAGNYTLKNMIDGEQAAYKIDDLISKIKNSR
ncbi:histidine--tRNA ligase [Reichenbachiella carrageenanivorans]|uniref:Histidine--tRNA ligase n=1 Tax=Reichenbachiella carrageenanivorans TaxID=2979869 RepID=A0ABY6CYE2_9BACT|nr:histidine--tRNA ligase [Reichenbachiella carrageenanivorans]UXX78941.1 histidine--tRNA ligase [Reichenbachiella carrageenanivorans]